MKADIQKIFSQYGITNKMHNDAYDWQKKYWEISNEISGKNEWEDICIGFFAYITLWTLILFGLAFLDDKSNISQDLLAFLIIVVLLNIFFYLMGKQENNKKEEYKHKIESHKLEKVHHSEYEYKEHKLASDYETELKNLQSKIFRKRVSETFKDNLQKYNDLIDTCSYINHYLVFAHINTYEHREYAKKRGYSLVTNNYSSLSKKILPKIEEDYSSSKPIESKSIKSKFNPQKIDWLELNKSNAKLGEYGESIIIDLEKEYLIENGLKDLSEKIEWVSQTKGDGAGYDILSYDTGGNCKYIEVKTTCVSENEPFYVSDNELNFIKTHLDNYFIYRLYIDKNSNTVKLRVFNSSEFLNFALRPVSYKVIVN
ncbi:MAG: DUF3883 domain-containing protein [Clostridia bacterium]|nr:DUF3883 domain-containing protein [Clostridia bacterium]